MNDYSGSSFALGYLAAGSATELAQDVAMTIVHGPQRRPISSQVVSLADYQALAERCAHLQAKVEELEDDVARVERNAERYRLWGRALYDEVVKLKTK